MGSSTLPMFAFQLVLLMLLRATTAVASAPPSPNVLLPHCQETCDGLSIPYPFGIDDGCFKEGFEVACEVVNGSATPTAFFGGVGVKDISLLDDRARLLKNISWECYNTTGGLVGYHSQLNLSGLRVHPQWNPL
ncbi:hypothetical protein BHM03_00015307 [Ensete ventricosum]|nr:hypothetical protein BHM03_00015307 [Ensete ventricosum]